MSHTTTSTTIAVSPTRSRRSATAKERVPSAERERPVAPGDSSTEGTAPDTGASPEPIGARVRGLLSHVHLSRVHLGREHRRHAVPLSAAVLLYLVSLQQFDLAAIDGLGLFSAAPHTFWLAGAVLLVGFGRLLTEREPSLRWGTAYLLLLIVVLHGTAGFVHEHPRFPTAWTHVGFVDYIGETGSVDTGYDARFNWPGAFSLGAFLTDLAGLESARALLRFAPVVMNALVLGAVALIGQQVSRDRRIRLAGLCVVVLGSWVGQDYLAPQAVAFLAYLTMIGVLLRYFRKVGGADLGWFSLSERIEARWPRLLGQHRLAELAGRSEDISSRRSAALYAMVLVIVGVTAFSHQLTPFVAAAAALALVLVGRVTRPLLPVTMVVAAVAWVAFGATTFLRSNLAPMLESIGDLQGSIDENVQGRAGGSAARELVLSHRLGLTAVIALLAAVGLVRQWRNGRADWVILSLALVPAPLLALNSYGGEVLLRVLLFMIPFLGLLAPYAFFTERDAGEGPTDRAAQGARRRRLLAGVGAFTALAVVALPVFTIARFGNESFERIYTSDIAAWDHVTEIAGPDTRVLVLNFAGPWRYSELEGTDYRVYPDEMGGDPTLAGTDRMVRDGGSGSMLLLGVGTARYGEVFLGEPADWQDELADALLDRAGYQEVFRRGESRILRWDDPTEEAAR